MPFHYAENPRLGTWVSTQRTQYNKFQQHPSTSQMTQERIERLESIAFEWDPLSAEWGTKFNELVAYKDAHGGSCNQGKKKYGETPNKGASERGISLPDNEFFTENNPLRADECKETDYQETIDRNVKNFRRRVIDPLARFNMDTMIEDTASSHDAVLKGRKSYYRTWKQPDLS